MTILPNKFVTAIIDGDPLVYRCGFSIESKNKELDVIEAEPVHHAYYNLNSMMNKILNLTNAENYLSFLTGPGRSNFRFDIFPEYKANRKDARRPVYYDEIRGYMQRKWKAVVIDGQEADDECSIQQYKLNPLGFDYDITNSIVCSIDKDFNNIPGWHLNYVKDEIYYITELEALRNFYLQILTGDASDGIPRIRKGWLKKKSENLILNAQSEEELLNIVRNEMTELMELDKEQIIQHCLYELGCKISDWETYRNESVNRELINRGRLVHLRRYEEELWLPQLLQNN